MKPSRPFPHLHLRRATLRQLDAHDLRLAAGDFKRDEEEGSCVAPGLGRLMSGCLCSIAITCL